MNTRKKLPDGFTLIELLTVIAIIGILAAILVPTVGKVRMVARKGKAISELRHVGVGVLQYANDRKDQRVPGAAPLGINPVYERPFGDGVRVSLQIGLVPYMNYRDPLTLSSSERVLFPPLMCPGVTSLFPDRNPLTESSITPHYIQNYTLSTRPKQDGSLSNSRVLGAQGNSTAEALNCPPIALTELDAYGGAARVWILTNLDQALPNDNSKMKAGSSITGSGWYSRLPETPVWGNSRLRLYFDAHVASVARDADP